jgi:hypothetical protein
LNWNSKSPLRRQKKNKLWLKPLLTYCEHIHFCNQLQLEKTNDYFLISPRSIKNHWVRNLLPRVAYQKKLESKLENSPKVLIYLSI